MKSESHGTPTRRRLLKLASGGGLGLTLAGLLRAQSGLAAPIDSAKRLQPAIKSCIVVFYYGGPSHLDTYDMKPDGPAEIRGEFRPSDSAVPGLQVSEHLPQMARVMDRCALIRSMHHTNRLHDSASTESLTGRQSPVGIARNSHRSRSFFHAMVPSSVTRSEADRWKFLTPRCLGFSIPWSILLARGAAFWGKPITPFKSSVTRVAPRTEIRHCAGSLV